MKVYEVVRRMINDSGKSMRQISLELGRSPSWLSVIASKGGDIRVSTLCDIASACDYEVMAVARFEAESIHDEFDPLINTIEADEGARRRMARVTIQTSSGTKTLVIPEDSPDYEHMVSRIDDLSEDYGTDAPAD